MAAEKIRIFDTTLRDGEQSPGASLSITEKLEIAQQLAVLGVDIIEAGFPVSSPAQFDATKLVAQQVPGPVITALARANKEDIKAAGDAIEPAKNKRIHTFIATSPIHMKHKLKKSPDEVLKMAVEAVGYAKTFTDDIEFSPKDAYRSDVSFLIQILTAVIEAGATTLNIPDTVGYVLPYEYGELIARLKTDVPGIDRCIISTHCHNDLGMAVANSLAGVRNGARQIECAVNGLGERAGNAALEEVVRASHTRAARTTVLALRAFRADRTDIALRKNIERAAAFADKEQATLLDYYPAQQRSGKFFAQYLRWSFVVFS